MGRVHRGGLARGLVTLPITPYTYIFLKIFFQTNFQYLKFMPTINPVHRIPVASFLFHHMHCQCLSPPAGERGGGGRAARGGRRSGYRLGYCLTGLPTTGGSRGKVGGGAGPTVVVVRGGSDR